jgi:hypothetical protein
MGIETEGSENSGQCGQGHGHITERQHGLEVVRGCMEPKESLGFPQGPQHKKCRVLPVKGKGSPDQGYQSGGKKKAELR